MRIELVAHTGSDLLVANAARRSFGTGYDTWSEEPRTARGRSDRELINDLARDGHWLPFRHPQVTLSCEAPLPVARQLGKHQVGFSWSEVSRRYITRDMNFYLHGQGWRSRPLDRRQGSGPLLDPATQTKLQYLEAEHVAACMDAYNEALELGASPEQARFLLPQSMEVAWTWTGSLLGWAELVKGRRHPDAQSETREFAALVEQAVEPLFPVSWVALLG